MTAIDWGFSIEDTAVRLLEESGRARENGQRYALDTVGNAAAVPQRQQSGSHASP